MNSTLTTYIQIGTVVFTFVINFAMACIMHEKHPQRVMMYWLGVPVGYTFAFGALLMVATGTDLTVLSRYPMSSVGAGLAASVILAFVVSRVQLWGLRRWWKTN